MRRILRTLAVATVAAAIAGSTWVQIALDQWRADAARTGLNINYQGVGSTAGRQFFIIGQVDFAASEIPFLPDEVRQLRGAHKSYQYLPDVAGGTAVRIGSVGHGVGWSGIVGSTVENSTNRWAVPRS